MASLERGGGGVTRAARKVCPKRVTHLDGNTNTNTNIKRYIFGGYFEGIQKGL